MPLYKARPIFQPFTSYTIGSQAGTTGSNTIFYYDYRKDGDISFVEFFFQTTLSGSSATYLTITVPRNNPQTQNVFVALNVDAGLADTGGKGIIQIGSNVMNIFKSDGTSFATGTIYVGGNFFYKVLI